MKSKVWHGTVWKNATVNVIKTKIVKKSVFEFSLFYFSQSLRYFSILTYNYVCTYVWYVKKHLQAINKQQYLYDSMTTAISNYQWPLVPTFFYEKNLCQILLGIIVGCSSSSCKNSMIKAEEI